MVRGGARPSTPSSTWICASAPSAVATAKTARPEASGEAPRRALPSAPARRLPRRRCGPRSVIDPANTPPARSLGASASGRPSGSMTDSRPPAPVALESHGRPKALLTEMPVGLETGGMSAVAASGLVRRLTNAGDCAVRTWTAPPSARACGRRRLRTAAGPRSVRRASVAIERTEPAAQPARARGAPKFEVLATSSRSGSRIAPARVVAAKSRLSWIGPPAWKSPTGLSAPAPGMPVASTRPVSRTSGMRAAARSAWNARGSVGAATEVRTGPRPKARMSARLPVAMSAQVPRPSRNGRGPRTRMLAIRVCSPRPASATRKHARVRTSTSATSSGSTRCALRTIASATKPTRKNGTALRALRFATCRGDAVLALAPGPYEQREQRREQEDAQELDDGRDVAADRRVRGARGDRLGGVRDGRAGPQAEGECVEPERVADEREQEDRRRPEHRDRRDGEGDLPLPGSHDGARRRDRGVPADSGTDSDEHGNARRHAEPASGERGEHAGRADRHDHEPERLRPDRRDRPEVEPQAEQDDPNAQHPLHREPDACHGTRRHATAVHDDEPQQHGQRDLEADSERERERELRDDVRGQSEGRGQRQARQDGAKRALDSSAALTRSRPDDSGGRDVGDHGVRRDVAVSGVWIGHPDPPRSSAIRRPPFG